MKIPLAKMRTTKHGHLRRVAMLGMFVLVGCFGDGAKVSIQADEQTDPAGSTVEQFFAAEVWPKVGERTCLKCHNAKGDAADSNFLLRATLQDKTALNANRAAFARIAVAREEGESRLLLKIRGDLDHGGGQVLKKDSSGYQILALLVRRLRDPDFALPTVKLPQQPFFDAIEMVPPRSLLRRVALSLAARLPTPQEIAKVEKSGLLAFHEILDEMMAKEAFYQRLKEAFNDILLIRGYDGVPERVLSYEHFPSRQWYQKWDLSAAGDKKAQQQARYKLIDQYREALLREPLELIAYIVRQERPFTEVVTGDYLMVSPYTARGYGIFDKVKQEFKETDNPFEYIPAKLPSLKNRSGRNHQPSLTGFYPHAGLLSSFQYLKRYPTSETNRNRNRVRMYYQHFLGVDIMALAPQASDAAKITAEYKIPTMQAAECIVCHKVIDPVAGLLQDYYVLDGKGIFGKRLDGWYQDMFQPGWEGEDLPAEQTWRSLQWLGQRISHDPRFAYAMVEHAWYLLTGKKFLLPPQDIEDPQFVFKQRAYRMQRAEMERIAAKFAAANFNLKLVLKELVQSDFYRVNGLSVASADAGRLAELESLGLVRMLTPEQLERKITAIFGTKWGKLTDRESKFKILYGGIDSKTVTERGTDPSGAMGAIQRILSNDVACAQVATDFSLPSQQRRLFPGIEPSVVPGSSQEADERILAAIVHLHELILGRFTKGDDPEVQRTFALFTGIVKEAKLRTGIDPRESYYCQSGREKTPRDPDPHYTIRAWRGVVTYLLRQYDFLYE